MSNPYTARQLAKGLTKKPRSRLFWNAFLVLFCLVLLLFTLKIVYQHLSDHYTCVKTGVYIKTQGTSLLTTNGSFDIPFDEEYVIAPEYLFKSIQVEDKLEFVVSKITYKVLEIRNEKEVLFKVSVMSIADIIACYLFLIGAWSLFTFLAILINIKHPGPKLRKMQSEFIYIDRRKSK